MTTYLKEYVHMRQHRRTQFKLVKEYKTPTIVSPLPGKRGQWLTAVFNWLFKRRWLEAIAEPVDQWHMMHVVFSRSDFIAGMQQYIMDYNSVTGYYPDAVLLDVESLNKLVASAPPFKNNLHPFNFEASYRTYQTEDFVHYGKDNPLKCFVSPFVKGIMLFNINR